jgi:hypothetical protein
LHGSQEFGHLLLLMTSLQLWRILLWEQRPWDTLARCAISGNYKLPTMIELLLTSEISARIPQIVKNYRDKSCEGMLQDEQVIWFTFLTLSRACTALLHPSTSRQCDTGCEYPVPFTRERLYHDKPTLADWFSRDHD